MRQTLNLFHPYAGIQSSDLGLIDAALVEMTAHAQDPRYAHDIVYLQASVLLLKVKSYKYNFLVSGEGRRILEGFAL